MTLRIEVSPELEQRLKEAAAQRGSDLSDYVRPALEALAACGNGLAEPGAESLLDIFEDAWTRLPGPDTSNLPEDLAEQHDHYAYNIPKRLE